MGASPKGRRSAPPKLAQAPLDKIIYTTNRRRWTPGAGASGMILGHVNAMLGRYGRRIGPDPASLHACTIGGVIANNSGAHALGGERHDKEALRRWFERLGRVLPTLHLTVNNIWVKGWPWHTTVFVQWDGSATLLNGDAWYRQPRSPRVHPAVG